jgi:hypothetical protein
MTDTIEPGQPYIDSRDVIERIEELTSMDFDEALERYGDGNLHRSVVDPDDQDEAVLLLRFADEADGNSSGFRHGQSFISDDEFENYARELAKDCGMISDDEAWPLNRIDWEEAADDLKQDYTSIEFGGHTYWQGN